MRRKRNSCSASIDGTDNTPAIERLQGGSQRCITRALIAARTHCNDADEVGLPRTGPSPNARRTMGRSGWMTQTWRGPGIAPQTGISIDRRASRSCQKPKQKPLHRRPRRALSALLAARACLGCSCDLPRSRAGGSRKGWGWDATISRKDSGLRRCASMTRRVAVAELLFSPPYQVPIDVGSGLPPSLTNQEFRSEPLSSTTSSVSHATPASITAALVATAWITSDLRSIGSSTAASPKRAA